MLMCVLQKNTAGHYHTAQNPSGGRAPGLRHQAPARAGGLLTLQAELVHLTRLTHLITSQVTSQVTSLVYKPVTRCHVDRK